VPADRPSTHPIAHQPQIEEEPTVHDIDDGGHTQSHTHTHTHTHDDPGSEPMARDRGDSAFRVGIGGPVGTGKTALVAALCRLLADELRVGVVTNDIYTTEDADTLKRMGVLDAARIVAVETGCCPHTAIREDITANLDAIEDLEDREGPLDLVLVESGGDNLTLTFSKGLVDVQLFVLDVAGGDKVPRKGGPGVTRSDLLVVNKIDIAHLVNADLGVMERDAAAQRGERPTVFISLTAPEGAAPVAAWIRAQMAGAVPAPG
jgi:urease accessory protein